MKKIIFFVPAIIFIAFFSLILISGIDPSISPVVFIWIALFITSGILLSAGKFWGGLFGLISCINLIYMSTKDTGQAVNIELPIGIIIALFYLLCCGFVLNNNKKAINENYTGESL